MKYFIEPVAYEELGLVEIDKALFDVLATAQPGGVDVYHDEGPNAPPFKVFRPLTLD